MIARPNTGKSTLFNRLTSTKYAITDKSSGTTRDRKEILNTAGWENEESETDKVILEEMKTQCLLALHDSDLALFLVDTKKGISFPDIELAKYLRKYHIIHPQFKMPPFLLIANKSENMYEGEINEEVHRLKMGDPLFISAEFGDGIPDLLIKIDELVPQEYKKKIQNQREIRINNFKKFRSKMRDEIKSLIEKEEYEISLEDWSKEFDYVYQNPGENSEFDEEIQESNLKPSSSVDFLSNSYSKTPIQISVIGRPNVGKSSLINSLLVENRLIVTNVPGTTRDSIKVVWEYKGKKIVLVDTAGIDKRLKQANDFHKKFFLNTLESVRFSQIVICLIDSLSPFTVQDLSLAQTVIKEGRCLILAVNKWDLVPFDYKQKIVKYLKNQLEKKLGVVKEIPLLFISAQTGNNVTQIMDEVLQVYEKWNIRISTGVLNDWLRRVKNFDNIPNDGLSILKMRFISQIKTRPPTFAVFVNDKNLIRENFEKFLTTNLSNEFGFSGVPIRIVFRDTRYKETKEKIKENNGKPLRSQFIDKRKVPEFIKMRLLNLKKQIKKDQQFKK